MRNGPLRLTFSLIALCVSLTLAARAAAPALDDAPQYGPARGSLIIIGGNMQESSGLAQKFIELAGGKDKNFVIVPTNNGNRNPDGSLHVYDAATVLAPWLEANGVWLDGGRQWNCVDSYAGTRALDEFRKVLDRGGAIAGSSAGATIQGDYLVRGDSKGLDIMMTEEPAHQHGFAFLRHVAIDQHINARNRWDDLIPVIKKYPDLLGIGLSEDTGIIVHGDQFEVMGKWKVAIHDNTRAYQPWEKSYFVLSQGDVYDMKARRVVKYGNGVTGRGGGGGGGGAER
jgi:cyanophycinase